MTGAAPLVWLGIVAMVGAVLMLRHAWGLPRRSVAWNTLAWALMLAGAGLALAGDGAWGLAIAALVGMATAAGLLAHAGWTAPRGKGRASTRKVGMLPEKGEPRHLGRRLATFLLVVPLGFVASLLLALGARALAGLAGWNDADGNVLTLLLLPLAWGLLAFWLLMLPRRRAQLAWLAAPAVAGLGLILIGGPL